MSIQMGWSLVSATIVRLKSFVENLGSGYLGATLNYNLGSYADTGSHSASRAARRGGTRDEVFEMQAVSSAEAASHRERPHFKAHNTEAVEDDTSICSVPRVSNDGSQEFIVRRKGEETHERDNMI